MEEVEAICNHIVWMDKGDIIEDCDKEELKLKYKKKDLESLEAIFLSITDTRLRDMEFYIFEENTESKIGELSNLNMEWGQTYKVKIVKKDGLYSLY